MLVGDPVLVLDERGDPQHKGAIVSVTADRSFYEVTWDRKRRFCVPVSKVSESQFIPAGRLRSLNSMPEIAGTLGLEAMFQQILDCGCWLDVNFHRWHHQEKPISGKVGKTDGGELEIEADTITGFLQIAVEKARDLMA